MPGMKSKGAAKKTSAKPAARPPFPGAKPFKKGATPKKTGKK